MRRNLPVVLALATVALAAAAWVQAPFANGPAEWEWAWRPRGLAGLGPALAAAALMLGAWLAVALLPPAGGRRAAGSVLGLLLLPAGVALPLLVARAGPGGFDRVFASLASRHSFGYAFDAGLAPPTAELLADYPRASAGLNLHARTHPPGPLLAVRGLDAWTRRIVPHPPAGRLLTAAQAAMAREVQRARDRRRPAPRHPPGAGALVALALLLPSLSAATAWPLYRLAGTWGLTPPAALLAALLWLLVPARSLFTPSLDQALPFFLVAAAWLAAEGGHLRAFLAGLLLWAACFASYGYLVGLPLASLIALAGHGEGTGGFRRRAWEQPLALAAGFLLPWLALAALAGYDPWTSFRAALAEHRAMAVATRGYGTWLRWNPYDFALLLGPAVLGLTAAAARPVPGAGRPLSLRLALLGWWGLLLLLLVSGSVRGEVGRIWLLFMPFACLFAARELADAGAGPPRAAAVPLAQAALLLALAATMVFLQ